ncbi:hypothetical protein [Enterococcus hermanniensis]|uniref:DUF1269 domain-containing protein n=1 Tax=Enterococcus hermanniensis TaxID=249189 RepID=A0A1L8TQD2_9ENTE|nr:hypothetical protein [Enterococcus hermanniensis]OJG46274.1 hypothetical protein RV04_GL001440 [Enterococcus hermanniensis]
MKTLALITYKENATAYEALSKLKTLNNCNTMKVKQAAVIEKNQSNSEVTIKDSLDFQSGNRVATGGLIGMIVGILGGPLGVLSGWIIGDLAGVGTNYVKTKKNTTIFDTVSQNLAPGASGLIIYMEESDETLIDSVLVNELAGCIERFDYQDVKEDIDHANEYMEEN